MNTTLNPTETTLRPPQMENVHRPQFRIKEGEEGTTVQIALPGVRKENLKLTLLESNLRIEADRTNEVPENWKVHRDPGAIAALRSGHPPDLAAGRHQDDRRVRVRSADPAGAGPRGGQAPPDPGELSDPWI